MHILYWGNGNPTSRVGTRTRHDHILDALRKRTDVEAIHYVDTNSCLQFSPLSFRVDVQVLPSEQHNRRALVPVVVYSLRNPIPFGNRIRASKRFALHLMARQVERSLKKHYSRGISLTWWICNARFWPVLDYARKEAPRGNTGILDCVDNMAAYWRLRAANVGDQACKRNCLRIAQEYEVGYRHASNLAELVVVNSSAKFDTYQNLGANVVLILSGVDFERFYEVALGSVEKHPDLKNVPEPRVGYVGPLHYAVDTELLERCAREIQYASFVFIGEIEPEFLGRFRDLPNVHFLGPRKWEEIPGFLAGMDIVLSAYRQNEVGKGLYSLKVLEALAAGCDVLALDSQPWLHDLGHTIRLAPTHDIFLSLLRQALNDPPATTDLRERRAETVRSRSWDSVAEEILRSGGLLTT
jgi:glycosyltransferase involved in cell wall biosynthesis